MQVRNKFVNLAPLLQLYRAINCYPETFERSVVRVRSAGVVMRTKRSFYRMNVGRANKQGQKHCSDRTAMQLVTC